MSSLFSYTQNDFLERMNDALKYAQRKGATAAEAEFSESNGQTVSVRLGEIETLEYNQDKGFSITVYIGQSKGNAGSSDFSASAIESTIDAALSIAKYTAADSCSGLPDEDRLASESIDLDLFHPWTPPIEQLIEAATLCEAAGLRHDLIKNSEGASISTRQSHFLIGNTLGQRVGYPTSRHSMSCSLIAGEGDAMQRDYWYSVARAASDLSSPETIGQKAAERTTRRLNARSLSTCEVPVLFDATLSSGLIQQFVSAISGGNLYRKSSFLLDSLGKQVFSPWMSIVERPFILRGLGSAPFDAEGVATAERDIVQEGKVQGYFLSSYSARKLGLSSTGSAGGAKNLLVQANSGSFSDLLSQMGTGVLVTELLGHGVNLVTGDYSQGAAGFWVEKGVIQYPIEEITIAGNLAQMFKSIVAIGSDVLPFRSIQCGSILIEKMMVAGAQG